MGVRDGRPEIATELAYAGDILVSRETTYVLKHSYQNIPLTGIEQL